MPRGNPAYKPGISGNPKGRPKGSKNEFTCLKDAFINAFKRIGGEDALVDFYQNNFNHKDFFKMVAHMLPTDVQVSGAGGKPLEKLIVVVPQGTEMTEEKEKSESNPEAISS